MEPYHPYVFDESRRQFVGAFEEMYRAEREQGFDSWHQDTFGLRQRLTIATLDEPRGSLLDIGCGKGKLTARLADQTERIVGVDVSPTAIEKARATYPDIDFRVTEGDLRELAGERFDLVAAIEVLSYVEDWRGLIERMAELGDRVFVSAYLPSDPIGFIKSFDDLRAAVAAVGEIETDVFAASLPVLMLGARVG